MSVNKFVLDACAVLALIKEEQGADVVKNAVEDSDDVFLHGVTFLEVYYNVIKEFGQRNLPVFIRKRK